MHNAGQTFTFQCKDKAVYFINQIKEQKVFKNRMTYK